MPFFAIFANFWPFFVLLRQLWTHGVSEDDFKCTKYISAKTCLKVILSMYRLYVGQNQIRIILGCHVVMTSCWDRES